MKNRLLHIIVLLMTFLFISQGAVGQMSNYKSLYLYNFIKRIEWPAQFAEQDFVIIIMGDENTAFALQQIAETKKAGDRNITVLQVKEPDEIERADLIYIDHSKRKYIEELVLWIDNQSILLVSDYKNTQLTDISLVETSDGLDFIIRPDIIREKDLNISDMLILLGTKEEE
jgi:hypothetical protein